MFFKKPTPPPITSDFKPTSLEAAVTSTHRAKQRVTELLNKARAEIDKRTNAGYRSASVFGHDFPKRTRQLVVKELEGAGYVVSHDTLFNTLDIEW